MGGMKILVACEKSGKVRDAFIKKGHVAWSCDILDTDSPGPHIKGRLEDVIGNGGDWDMIVAFPPCTHLAVSGARYFAQKLKEQEYAIAFFMMIMTRDCPKISIENPVGIMSTRYRKPDQIIQPWMFGHPESKKTCLWLHGLPLLTPTNILQKPERGYWDNQTPSGQNKLGPSPDRATLRGITYQGIANAMAEQWG